MTNQAFRELLPGFLDLDFALPFVRSEGEGRARRVQEFGEFRGHVPYSPGEDLRFLDWKVLARSGERVLRRFDGREHRLLAVAVDDSASMQTRSDGVRQLAMLYLYLGLHRYDELALLFPREARICYLRGPESFERSVREVEAMQFEGSEGCAALPSLLSEAGIQQLLLISDFSPEEASTRLFSHCAEARKRLFCVFPRMPFEAAVEAAPLSGHVVIQDPEDGRELRCEIGSTLYRAFLEEQAQWEIRLRSVARELGHRFLAETLPSAQLASSIEAWTPFLGLRERMPRF